MLFMIIDLIVSIVVASYLYPYVSDIIDTLYTSANSVVVAGGGTVGTNTTWAWHFLAIGMVGAIVFGSIWFIKNLISNRNRS